MEEVKGLRHQQIQPWERVIPLLAIRRCCLRRLHVSLLNCLGFLSTLPPPASSSFVRRQTLASEASTTTVCSFFFFTRPEASPDGAGFLPGLGLSSVKTFYAQARPCPLTIEIKRARNRLSTLPMCERDRERRERAAG